MENISPRTNTSEVKLPLYYNFLYIVAWIPPVLVGLHLKFTLLDVDGGGYALAARILDRNSVDHLSQLEKLAYFREDLLILSILTPLVVLLLLRFLSPVFRALLVLLFSIFVSLLLYTQVKCFWEVGVFLPLEVLAAGATDVGADFLPNYLKASSIIKLLCFLAFTIFFSFLAWRWDPQRKNAERRFKILPVVSLISVAVVLVLNLASWISEVPDTKYTDSAIVQLTSALFRRDDSSLNAYDGLSQEELIAKYRELSNAPIYQRDTRYWAKAKDYDVLLIVLETAPAQSIDLFKHLDSFSTLKRLSTRAFVAEQHQSVYPYTSRAISSIYSSWYCSNKLKDFIRILDADNTNLVQPGVIRGALNSGYDTAVFVPYSTDNWEHDDSRFNAAGFSRVFVPDFAKYKDTGHDNDWRTQALAKDLEVLGILENEITKSIDNNQRYFYSYQPQYSHGPWPGVTSNSTLEEAMSKGRDLFSEIDSWLGRVVSLIEQKGRLEKTLIIVTGDHGARTRTEHPMFKGGTLNQMTFHMPLFIFAPGVISERQNIPWLTSHIDIAPTVLDLIGVGGDRETEQGSPIWDSRMAERRTFFFAKNYLGVDGYYYQNRASMIRHIFNSAYQTDWDGYLDFQFEDILPDDSAEHDEIESILRNMSSLQSAWSRLMIAE